MSESGKILDKHARMQATLFEEDMVFFVEALIVSEVKRKLIKWFYNRLVHSKKLSPVEKIDEGDKHKLWDECRHMAEGRLTTKEELKQFSICMYTMLFLSENLHNHEKASDGGERR